jgi:hypothetical protein
MDRRVRRQTLAGVTLLLLGKYHWYRSLGYPRKDAARKAAWRAGLWTQSRASESFVDASFPAGRADSSSSRSR